MANTLEHDIAAGGSWQADVFKWMENVNAIVNELQTDHATMRTEVIAIGTSLASTKAIYDAHTHLADGNANTVSLPDTSSATGSAGAASAITDTSGSSVPATLTNSTALKLTKG
jgi:hypothetical protein